MQFSSRKVHAVGMFGKTTPTIKSKPGNIGIKLIKLLLKIFLEIVLKVLLWLTTLYVRG